MAGDLDFVDDLKPLGVPDKTTPSANDFSFIDGIKAQTDNARNAALRQAVPVNPDTAAKEKNIAAQTGVPVSVVTGDTGELADRARINEINRVLTASPILARQMADPEFAKLAHDDAENLSLFERVLAMPRSAVAGAVADLPSAIYGWGEGLAKLLAPLGDPLAGTILPDNPLRRVAAGLENFRKQTKATGDLLAGPQSKDLIEGGISSGFRSVGNMAPGVALAVATGNPQFALIPGTAIQGGQSVSKGLDAGLSPVQSLTYGLEDSAAEYATELLPMGVLLKDIKASAPFWKLLGHQIATEVPTELAATAWQNFNEWANVHPDKPFKDYLSELPEAEAQTVIATITASVLTAGFGRAVAKHQERQDSARNTQASDLMQKLFDIAKDDELRRRSPTDFASFVQTAAEEHGSGHVYVDAATFAQAAQEKGFDVAAQMPETAAQMHEAIAMKGDLRIPIGEATTALPGTGLEQTLFQHMRVTPDAPTLKEAQDKGYAEETQKAVEQVMAEQNFNEAISTSRMAVENEFLAMHEKAGRFTTDVNKVYAKMDAAFLTTMGARVGLTPEEMYVKYGREIKSKIEGRNGENVMKQTPMEKRVADFLTANPVPEEVKITPEEHAAVEPNIRPILEAAEKNRPAFNKTVKKIAASLGATSRAAGVKKMDRSVEKVVKEYKGKHEKLLDALRSTITVDSPADAAAVIEAIKNNFYVVPGRIKDRFAAPSPSGYSDVLVNVRLPDGSYGEIQVITPEMAAAKKLAHNLYKVARSVPEGSPLYVASLALQQEIYADAKASNSSRVMGVPSPNALPGLANGEPSGERNTLPGSIATGEPSTSRNLVSGGNSIDSNLAQAKLSVKTMSWQQFSQYLQPLKLRDSFGLLSAEDKKQIAAAGEQWTLQTVDPITLKTTAEKATNETPIIVGQDGDVIDGRNRLNAAVNNGDKAISAWVASEVYNQETIDNETGALDEKPPFYSVLSMQIAAAKMNNAPAAQWKSFINSLAQKGVKKEEISMSGVLDWLDTIGKPVPDVQQQLQERRDAINVEGEEAKLIVQGKQLYEWLTEEGAVPSSIALTVADAILDARESSRRQQSVNWRDAKMGFMREAGIHEATLIGDMITGDALALRAIDTLRDLDAAGEIRFNDDSGGIITVDGLSIDNALADVSPRVRVWAKRAIRLATEPGTTNFSMRYANDFFMSMISGANEQNTTLGQEARDAWVKLSGATVRVEMPSGAHTSTAVVPVAAAPAALAKKPDTRVSKQDVIDYLASDKNIVRPENIKTKILGGTEAEQEGAKKSTAVVPQPTPGMMPDRALLPPDFNAHYDVENNQITVVAPDGATQNFDTPSEAISGAKAWQEEQKNLPSLPDDYDYEINDEGQYVVTYEPDDEELDGGPFDTRREAMEAINEHYEQHEGYRGEPSDEQIEEKARELLERDAREIARDYASNSDYANYSFPVAFRPPTYKVVTVKGLPIKDLFTGKETRDHYRVVQLTFEQDMPGDEDVNDTDGSASLEAKGMPKDVDDFWEMYEPDDQETVGPEFADEHAAHEWAKQNVDNARTEPVWIPWDRENYGRRHDPESGDNEGGYDSFDEAHRAMESTREGRYENEVENVEQNIEDYVDMEQYTDLARDALEGEESSEPFWDSAELRQATRVSGWNQPRQVHKPRDALALQHEGSYQSDGGRDYRELPTYIPGIEPFESSDSTHFSTHTGGRTVVWTRLKIHDDNNGVPTGFIEENQSRRGEEGLSKGFRDPALEAEDSRLEAENAALRSDLERIQARNVERQLTFYGTQEGLEAIQRQDLADEANARAALNEGMARRHALGKRIGKVPTAPFVTETKSWAALGLKRALRYFADYNSRQPPEKQVRQIAWTTGAQNAVRYGTKSLADSLKWTKVEGGVEVLAIKDGKTVINKKFNPEELRGLGARPAQEIINDPAQSGEMSTEHLDELNGIGMQAFYGDANGIGPLGKPSIHTIVANQVLKELGVAERTGKIDLTVTEEGKGLDKYEGAPGFKFTPEMESKINAGQKLFQQNRGQISFGSDIKAQKSVITLLENADLSTYIHESGHFYLEVLADMASQPDAPIDVQADMQRVLDWFGIPTLANWNDMKLEDKRPYHERFARGFERYIFEGKAPSIELAGMFSRFRAWMLNVYREITKLNVEVTDEVRGVFDRMLASNDEIVQAEAARSYAPLFKSAAEMGATPDEWKAYQEQAQEATQEAVNLLEGRALRDMKWLSNAKSAVLKKLQKEADSKREAVRSEVTKEVRATPTYAVLRFLTHGELDTKGMTNRERKIAEAFAGMKAKLSIPALKEMYGDGPAAPWRYLNTGKFGTIAAEDGLEPGMVAELFGMTSGDQLVKEILAAEPEDELIDAMTDKRMLERYGDMTDPRVIEEAANAAIHNEVRAKFLATELRALAKATGQKNILVKAAKEFAATLIDRKKIVEIRPAQYTAAEARAGRNAEKTSNLVEKATEKRNQIVNHYAAKAAYDAIDYVEKNVAYLRRVGDSKTIDAGYIEQIQALLERFDLRKITNKDAARRETLAKWVQEQEDKGFTPLIDPELLDESKRTPYKSMTLEEFRGLVDSVKSIEHIGRLKHKLLTAKNQREFEAAVNEIKESIVANAKRKYAERRMTDRGFLVKMGSLFRTATAVHRQFASLVQELDGFKDGGTAWEYFVRSLNEKGAFEAVETEKAAKALIKLFKPFLKGRGVHLGPLAIGDSFIKREYIAETGKSFSREERIGIALNMGNATNRERVLSGENLTPAQLGAILGKMTAEDLGVVRDTWAYLETFWPQIAAKEKRVTGVEPERVQAALAPEIAAAAQKLGVDMGEGGYYPIAYDSLRSEKSSADLNAEVQRQIAQGLYTRSQTARGHTKARSESTGRALRYDFASVVSQHVTQVIHDLAWHEYLLDANRLLRSTAIEHAVKTHYNVEVLTELKKTLTDIAVGNLGSESGTKFFDHLRYGVTISALGLNVFNTLQNLTGITQSMSRIGTKWVLKGALHWAGDAAKFESAVKKMQALDPNMAMRDKTMQREINEMRNKVEGTDSKLTAVLFYLQNKTQLVVDTPTWWGAYEKAMAEDGMDSEKAIALAYQAVVDAQGGGQIKDLSRVMRLPVLKPFTVLMGYFNTTFNNTARAYGRTNFKKPGDIAMFTADMVLLYSLPALLSTLLKAALQGDWDDEEKLLKKILGDQISYLMGMMVGLREMSAGVQEATGTGEGFGYSGPVSAKFFADFYKLGQQIHQGEADAAFWKSLDSVGGTLLHYPSGQINRTVEGIAALSDGRTTNPGAILMGPKQSER